MLNRWLERGRKEGVAVIVLCEFVVGSHEGSLGVRFLFCPVGKERRLGLILLAGGTTVVGNLYHTRPVRFVHLLNPLQVRVRSAGSTSRKKDA